MKVNWPQSYKYLIKWSNNYWNIFMNFNQTQSLKHKKCQLGERNTLLLTLVSAFLLYQRYRNNFKNISSSGIPGHFFVSPSYTIPRFIFILISFFFIISHFKTYFFHTFFNIFYVIPWHFLEGINLLYHLSFLVFQWFPHW